MAPGGLKARLVGGDVVLNAWLSLGNPFAAEVMASGGWDALTLDLQHGMLDYGGALAGLQALGTRAPVLARVPWNEPGAIMKLLDAGCAGIICPMVNSAAEAAAFARACRYPPQGYRSYGPTRAILANPAYPHTANDAVLALAMVETPAALENLATILETPGLDGVYVGPADLAQGLGFEPGVDPEEPILVEALQRVARETRARGKVAGLFCGSPAYAGRMAAAGYNFLTVSSDVRLLAAVSRSTVAASRAAIGGSRE